MSFTRDTRIYELARYIRQYSYLQKISRNKRLTMKNKSGRIRVTAAEKNSPQHL